MSNYTRPIIDVIIQLSEDQQLKVTVSESLKGAALTGACAFAGGLIGGPIGLGVGGVLGASVASFRAQGKFKSLVHVIMYDMTNEQKQKLAMSVQRAIQNVHKEDLLLLLPMVMQSTSLQNLIVGEVKNFMLREMRMRLM